MEEYARACCNRGYYEYKVQTVLLAKAFVHDSILHYLVCRAIVYVDRHVDNDPSGSEDHPSA